jgi:hypothetical protein
MSASYLHRAGLATILAVVLLITPAIVQSPGNSASAGVIYDGENGRVVDCGFITCSLYLSRSDVRALAYDYANELDLAQGLTAIACTLAVRNAVAGALCGTIFNYVVEKQVRGRIRQAADEGKCVEISFLPQAGIFGRMFVSSVTTVNEYDGKNCRE